MGAEPEAKRDQDLVKEIVEEFGLVPIESGFFAGKVDDFPMGFKFIASGEILLLLAQVRFPFDAVSNTDWKFQYDIETKKLMTEGRVEISVEDKIAWITLPNIRTFSDGRNIGTIIRSILSVFAAEGLAGLLPHHCHYCRKAEVNVLTCFDGKVAQICDDCIASKKKVRDKELDLSIVGLTGVVAMGSLASLFGAVAWAMIWVAEDHLAKMINSRIIFMPRGVMLALLLCVGLLIGGPVGLIIRQMPGRGDLFAAWAGIIFSIISSLIGEFIFVAWIIYKQFSVLSLSVTIQAIPNYLKSNDPVYLTEKTWSCCGLRGDCLSLRTAKA